MKNRAHCFTGKLFLRHKLSAAHQFSLANCVILKGVDKGLDLCILDLNPIAVAERQTVRGDVPSCVETPTSGN